MASSSSSPPSVPSFSSHPWKYDVFLSFRGEDTRCTFVDHLYTALERQGINTYKDDITLPQGESIGPSLIKAIRESQIALIVFSKNYGDSSWCLDELTHIMKCRDTGKQTVMPIFYDVDPSEVRKQKGKYGEAFSKHELENKAKVESWRKAVVDASSISGWEPRNIANGHEAKGIEQIVGEILQKLQPLTLSANESLIGMAARMQRLKLELQVRSAGVRMIGIWGVGGGGKTTLASSVYDEICRQFDGCCFVPNIREESSRHGLGKLEENILSKMRANSVGGGRCLISNRFRNRKVLIVLDDVDHLDQLKALAGSHDWFGDGSRILITTRDKHLLTAHKVNAIHDISLLNDKEALKLFKKHAPPLDNRPGPVEDYEHLLKEVVSYAGGLPLALTVLGSFLCDKDIDEWRSALARLKEIPNDDIVGKLKISFDGLTKAEKDVFLDISCFFRREHKDTAMKILDDCGFYPVIGVKVLIQKALITISEDGNFDMHDLVQEMAHYIVRGEHPNNPEKHSRIWKEEDVLKICAMDATTELDRIEAIRFQSSRKFLPQHLPPIVANTKNLRWIEWEGDFACHLLSNFPQRTLCHLVLYGSLQEQLWEGFKLLPNLKTMELFHLDKLIVTPDFDGLPNLKRFTLRTCECLKEIHPSIGCLEKLVFLCIEFCFGLKMFPPVTGLEKLETLSFRDCPQLFKSEKEVASYKISSINFFVTWLTSCCSNLPGLEFCLEEPSLPHNNMNHHLGLRFFLRDLRKMNLSNCSLGDKEMGSAVWELPNLKTLDLSDNKFSRLSFNLLQLPQLKWLDVSWCERLVKLSELPSNIAVVKADWCLSLESFGDISNCEWLWNVSLLWGNKHGDGDILLDSMLQGNAIEDYFINVALKTQIPKGFVGRLLKGRTSTLHLRDDWYNEFCGMSVCVVTEASSPVINIVIKQEAGEDSLFEVWQESKEALEPVYDGEKRTYVGYVSFGSLRHTAFSNSSFTVISVLVDPKHGNSYGGETYVGVELVPRKRKGNEPQTTKVPTDYSEFWDEDLLGRQPPFRIKHDSKSSIKIKWKP